MPSNPATKAQHSNKLRLCVGRNAVFLELGGHKLPRGVVLERLAPHRQHSNCQQQVEHSIHMRKVYALGTQAREVYIYYYYFYYFEMKNVPVHDIRSHS